MIPAADPGAERESDPKNDPLVDPLAGIAVSHRSVSANGIHFHLVEAGVGPSVVLLHGFGQTWENWRHQIAGLSAAGYRVAAPDLRGAGRTDKPPRGYDAFTLSADVAGLVRSLGERDAVLVGHGYGGVLAFNAAIMHPDQVRAVVAIAAPHPARMARVGRHLIRDPYGRLLAFAGAPLFPDRRLAAAGGARLERIVRSGAGPAWAASADFAATIALMREAIVIPGSAKGAVEQLRWVARSPWRTDGLKHREALEPGLVAPVLQLVGEGDHFTPPEVVAQAREQCHGPYQLEIVHGVGHYPAEEAPHRVNQLIARFLRDL